MTKERQPELPAYHFSIGPAEPEVGDIIKTGNGCYGEILAASKTKEVLADHPEPDPTWPDVIYVCRIVARNGESVYGRALHFRDSFTLIYRPTK